MTNGAPVIASVSLGRTDLEVSRMILGCASIGGLYSPTDPQMGALAVPHERARREGCS